MDRMTKKTDYGYINIPNNSKFIEPKDYGNTWALTKDELE